MITVYLARHGQTEENLSRIFQGHLPGTLTEEGKQQAVELGQTLREIPLDAVVSSDLQRVVDTESHARSGRPAPAVAADDFAAGNRLGTVDRTDGGECGFESSACRGRDPSDVVRPCGNFSGVSVAAL